MVNSGFFSAGAALPPGSSFYVERSALNAETMYVRGPDVGWTLDRGPAR